MKKNILKTLGTVLLVLFLIQLGLPAQAQSVITGTITASDEEGGLPGVSILEKGTSNGTVTDFDGNYSLKVGSGSTLVISYIGYTTQEVVVGNQSTVSVVLEPDVETLEEIVVIGYGTQKKAELSSAVSSVDVENLQKLPGANVAGMLQGQVAGVTSTSGSGSPGSAPVIRVRGLGTIGNNDPLFVIDGIPGDISSINPNDIESINVLKDAAAATIYGSRASNGVVVITTKRGKVGPPVVSLNAYVGVSSITKKIDVLNREQNNQVSTAAYVAEGQTPLAYTTLPITTDTDWQDEMFRNGIEQKYDLGISGGNEFANYNFSVGFFDKEGTIIATDYNRYNLRMNIDFKLSDRFTIGQTISYARSERNRLGEDESVDNGGNSGLSPILQILESMPHNAVYDPNSPNGYAEAVVSSGNVVGLNNLITDKSNVDNFQANVYLEAKIIESLKFRTRFGVNMYGEDQVYHVPTYTFGPQSANDKASLWELRSKTSEWVWNNVLDYNKTFGDHSVSALVGVSAEERVYKSTGGSNNELPSNKLMALGAGIGDANSFGSNVTRTISSVFGQFNYAFGDKYLVQASIRRDGSSRFGEDNRYGVFPSVSLGWRISSEEFFNVPIISNLKPRISIGTLGNQNIDDYLFLARVSSNNSALNYPLGGEASQVPNIGTISRSLASYDIKWEESTTRNVGLDLGLLDDQFTFTFDYFHTETSDMLVGVPVPATSGITITPVTNGGQLVNKGWELALTYKKVKGDFQFNIAGNITSNRNEVTKLGFADESFTNGHVIYDTHPTTRTEVGRSIGEFYLFKTDGLFQNQGEIDAHGIQPNAQPGDLKFVDTNNDGELNDDDRTYLGSGIAAFEYGLTFNASFKKFDFSLFLQGSQGNEIYNGTKVYLYRRQVDDKNFSADLLNAWTPSNTNTSVPRVTMLDANQNIRPSDYFMEDGSYLRLKNVQLGYSFGEVNNLFSSARVYVAAENLLTISGYDGYDPGNTGYQQFSRGVDVGLYPLSRNLIMGVQLKF
ncbi:SusC/RagA family TonB-linked outer membrane protein [Reichenbachiella sp.]|uniref:SusC/RagA family TonB-linked outer membrane protein n=1 Tax=Reichenbachiella sp. TaxID=2184521 RepID=UPI003B5A6A5C